jgi:hypothetical protein
MGCVAAALWLAASGAVAQGLADVEIGSQIPPSPQPTTYTWNGERRIVSDPGGYFYHFYYTGAVQPDARVLPGEKVERIAVRMNEWDKHRRWIIARLTNFYQVANGQAPTAMQDYQREIQLLESGGVEENPILVLTPEPTPPPAFSSEDDDFVRGPGGFSAGAFGNLPGGFDAKAAAEWTFYYDQLVLWQYYCATVLLREADAEILETDAAALSAGPESDAGGGGGGGGATVLGQSLDTGLAVPPSQIFSSGDDDSGGGGFAVAAGPGLQNQRTAREIFNPMDTYRDPSSNFRYRDLFIDKAQETEQELFQVFVGMVSEIEKRELNRERHTEWLAQRQAQIHDFADNWRKLREGDTVILDNTLFLITPEELESPPLDAINVQKTERLTPQDLLTDDGSIRRPVVQ